MTQHFDVDDDCKTTRAIEADEVVSMSPETFLKIVTKQVNNCHTIMRETEATYPITAKTIPDREHERREKVVYFDESMLIDVLNWCNQPAKFRLSLPVCETLPEGTRVLRVWASPERRAIGAIVSHESFEIVPDGCVSPEHPHWLSLECKVIERGREDEALLDYLDKDQSRVFRLKVCSDISIREAIARVMKQDEELKKHYANQDTTNAVT